VPFLQGFTLGELFSIYAILKIPFVVIVQPHLLKDKGSVSLWRIPFDNPSGLTGGNEIFRSFDNLASTGASVADEDADPLECSTSNESEPNQKSGSLVERTYVDTDQFCGFDRQVSTVHRLLANLT
jgi:hypothetical protein